MIRNHKGRHSPQVCSVFGLEYNHHLPLLSRNRPASPMGVFQVVVRVTASRAR